MSNPLGPDIVACPACGHQVPGNVPLCGNCGYQLGGPHMPASIGDSGQRRARFVVAVAVIGGLVALAWAGTVFVRGRFDSAAIELPDFDEITDDGGGSGTGDQVKSPYKGVRELVAALNKGGLRCTNTKVDAANSTVATGSCQAPGETVRTHVQINIYFSHASLRGAEDIFAKRAFNYVHDENWFVVTQLPTARAVLGILGGRLVKAK